MPIPTVWIVTRRPKKAFVGVAGGLKGAEDLAEQDARLVAASQLSEAAAAALTVWSEHGEAPAPGKKFTRASVHVASALQPDWTLTYDCVVHTIYQRPTPKKTPRLPKALEQAVQAKQRELEATGIAQWELASTS
jgi:hypothetical protein